MSIPGFDRISDLNRNDRFLDSQANPLDFKDITESPILQKCQCMFICPAHNGNIAAFNVLTTELITTNLLDLDIHPLDELVKTNHIQFRGMMVNGDQLIVVNGNNADSLIAVYSCDADRDQWTMVDCFGNDIPGLIHPYGIQRFDKYGWTIITTQATNCVFILDDGHNIVRIIDSKIPPLIGFRGLAVDNELDLIFVASPYSNNVLVFDIGDQFRNTFNISLPEGNTQPTSLVVNEENVLFVSDRQNHKVYAFEYTKNGVSLKWTSQFNSGLQKPTGLALKGRHLFVIAQQTNRILVYNSETGLFRDEMVDWREVMTGIGKGEQLLFLEEGHPCALH